MKRLSKKLLHDPAYTLPPDVAYHEIPDHVPETVLQFGEGNFLRGFADWFFTKLNAEKRFTGRVVVVQPLREGRVDLLNEQDGLSTLILRGYKDGRQTEETVIISCVSRGINPYAEWDKYAALAESPDLRYIISNTTEAGIVYNPADRLTDTPPDSFPGKVLVFLYKRYIHFNGSRDRGMVIIPCELTDKNGELLKSVLLKLCGAWSLPRDFTDWIEQCNIFVNTLVDRTVPGYPADAAGATIRRLQYEDKLLNVAEMFHLWILETEKDLKGDLPLEEAGFNVRWVTDMSPYRTRKVRILNGAHTASVPAAYLSGIATVDEMMNDPIMGRFVRDIIRNEIVPVIDDGDGEAASFAEDVIRRFENPLIKHYLTSILLNCGVKYRVRVLPSLIGYIEKYGSPPQKLTFSFAALIALYRGGATEGNAPRLSGAFKLADDPGVLAFMRGLWEEYGNKAGCASVITDLALKNENIWGCDLSRYAGLREKAAFYLDAIIRNGIESAVKNLVYGDRDE